MNCVGNAVVLYLVQGSMLLVTQGGVEVQDEIVQGTGARSVVVEGGIQSDWAIQTEVQAVRKALQTMGLIEGVESYSVEARLISISVDDTPFLSNQIAGRPLWQTVIGSVRLKLEAAAGTVTDSFVRTFEVLIDPRNGHPLKIISRWPDGVPQIAPVPPARLAEAQMRRVAGEKYIDFPAQPPAITLLEALAVVRRDGVGDPLVAKQIVAQYVLRSEGEQAPIPVWAITLRGIGPLPGGGPGVPIDARNHIRNIVDAQTGKWLTAVTTPQPVSGIAPQREQRRGTRPAP